MLVRKRFCYNAFVEGKDQSNISRRDVLKTAAVVAATVTASSVLGLKAGKLLSELTLSPEKKLNPKLLMLDFFDFPPLSSQETTILQNIGVEDFSSTKGLLAGTPQSDEETKLLMRLLFQERYKGHGHRVCEVATKTRQFLLGNQTEAQEITTYSLFPAVKIGEIAKNELGNPVLTCGIDGETLSGFALSFPSVINLSAEVGQLQVTLGLYKEKQKYPEMGRRAPSKSTIGMVTTYRDFQGNLISEKEYDFLLAKMDEKELVLLAPEERGVTFTDGYYGEETENNVLELVKVANNHPEKMFVVAGGNPFYFNGTKFPDIREARRKLTEEKLWPDNLIVVGFKGKESGQEGLGSFGADVYVSWEDLKKLGFSQASSYATPVVSEIVSLLIARGYNTHQKVREALISLTEAESTVDITDSSKNVDYKLLNLALVKEKLN